jgi:hypothetical protein
VLVCLLKILLQTNGRDFREIPGQRACNAKNNYQHKRTKADLKNTFLPNTDKYSAVFIEYSVAEYSAGYYSDEYSADRIVGRSLFVTTQVLLSVLYEIDLSIQHGPFDNPRRSSILLHFSLLLPAGIP